MKGIRKYSLVTLLASGFAMTTCGSSGSTPSIEELMRILSTYQAQPIMQPQRPRVIPAMTLNSQVAQEFAEWIRIQLESDNPETTLSDDLLAAINFFLCIPGTVSDGLAPQRQARANRMVEIIDAYRYQQHPIQDQGVLNLFNFLRAKVMPLLLSKGFSSGSVVDMKSSLEKGVDHATESEKTWFLENFPTFSKNAKDLRDEVINWKFYCSERACDAAIKVTVHALNVLLEEEVQLTDSHISQIDQFAQSQLEFQAKVTQLLEENADAREKAAQELWDFQNNRHEDGGKTYVAEIADEIEAALRRELQIIEAKEARLNDLLKRRPLIKALSEAVNLRRALRMAVRPIK